MSVSEMIGKERVCKAIRREAVDRTPWVPFVGCHAGALTGVNADEFLRSADHIVEGMLAAVKRYQPDGIPVTFDLQLEAEALGCELNWAEDNPPAVCKHPLMDGKELSDLSIPSFDGRLGEVFEATRRLRSECPDIALYGLITGPFTLALHLLGTDIFMLMFENTEKTHALLDFCRQVCEATAAKYIEAGCDVIAVVDPMTSQIGPDHFREFVLPHAEPVFASIRDAGALSSFFVCGHAEQNLSAMADCGCDNISIDENISLECVKEICDEKGISFGGNMQLTSVLLLGTPQDAQRNALACLDVGGSTGYLLAPGCDLPYATPPENLEAVAALITDPYQQEVIRTLAQDEDTSERLNLQEYGQHRKVIVDIITLDSEACAPCQYMVDAVRRVAPEFEGIVEWREHKIKYRESLVFMTSLMVRNVPTICIDGQITFVSRIPPKGELIAAIQKRINEKFRLKLERRRGTFHILAKDTNEVAQIKEQLDQAMLEMGCEVPVEIVDDPARMASDFGIDVEQSPSVVLTEYHLKSTKSIPEVNVIKEWLKDLS